MGFIELFLIGFISVISISYFYSHFKKFVFKASIFNSKIKSLMSFAFSLAYSKKADLKKAAFTFTLMLFIYSLFLSVFPGNERVLSPVCAVDECSGSEGDTDSGTCSAYGACNGGPQWSIGGEVSTTACCGDDTALEWVINETSSTDAPSGYDGAAGACCNTVTDCETGDVCYTTNTTSNSSIPNKAWCYNTDWYGGDNNQSSCYAVVGSIYWSIGGEAATTSCCGDDSSEYLVIEKNSTDAPSPYNNNGTGTSCCDTSTDCTETGADTCTASESGAGSKPNRAWCYMNTWYGGDKNQSSCDSVTGTGNWSIGGETATTSCCGDDNSEFAKISTFNAEMDGAADGTDGCCTLSSDCIDSGTCYDNNTLTYDADGDSDNDYCLEGAWYDCKNNSQCTGGKVCFVSTNNCISSDGFLRIYNLGMTGIENISNEFTSIRTVLLEMNYTDNTTYCRHINYDNPTSAPSNTSTDWAAWETCVRTKVWTLSANSGNKTVYFQVNYSSPVRSTIFNDSIYFNYTGAGLDTTPPSAATIVDGDYTNSNQSITISWYGAYDAESALLNIPLSYQYLLFHSNGTTLETTITIATSYTSNITSFNFPHGTTLYVNITVINSAGLTAKTKSDGLILDFIKPTFSIFKGTYYNLSSLSYGLIDLLPNSDTWVYASSANFSWLGTDATSYPVAYSYILTKGSGTMPDDVPEGDIANLSTGKSKAYSNLQSAKYYFYIKVKDAAGNWGNVSSLNFSIDTTPPSKPVLLSQTRNGNNVTYTWSASTDSESSVLRYRINLSYSNGSFYKSNLTTGLNMTFYNISSGDYNVSVGAMNGVGLWKWSNEEDIISDSVPPTIIATPNRTVITNTPIIRAWTNEQAYCVYNISSTTTDFTYTNTTYHEAKASSLTSGNKYVTITCADMSGNTANLNINFTIDTSRTPNIINASSSLDTYEDILTTVPISVKNGTIGLAGLTPDRFSIKLDGEEEEVSVFDFGDGSYNVTFYSPDEPSIYQLTILVDSTSLFSLNLSVDFLYMYSSYSKAGISARNTSHITYFDTGNNSIGLATDEDTDEVSIESSSSNLSISNIKMNENLFIFNTKSGLSVSSREDLLNSRVFLNKVIPSFGYQLDDSYIIHFILRYDSFAIQSEMGDELKKGYYNALARNSISTDGERTIIFSDAGSEDSKIVVN